MPLLFKVSSNYTNLAMLAFLYCFVVNNNRISAKQLPEVGIGAETLGLWHLLLVTHQSLLSGLPQLHINV